MFGLQRQSSKNEELLLVRPHIESTSNESQMAVGFDILSVKLERLG